MIASEPFFAELNEILAALRDGEIESPQAARLEELVREHPPVREYYVDYISLCLSLKRCQSHVSSGELAREFAQQLASPDLGANGFPSREDIADGGSIELARDRKVEHGAKSFIRKPLSYRQSLSLAAFFGALSVIVLLFGLAIIPSPREWFAERRQPPIAGPADDLTPAKQTVVAHLTAAHEPRWSQPSRRVPHGQPLRQGSEWRLEAGMVELTFKGGARVALEGPARFQVLAEDRLHLAEGCLVATVNSTNDPAATGFTVDTAAAAIIDLGTQFGVAVNDDRRVEVYVLEGVVEVCEPGSKGPSDGAASTKIDKGESAVIEPGDAGRRPPRVTRIDSNADRFQRLIPAPGASGAEHPLAHLKVLAHFRLGEDDRAEGAAPFQPGDNLPQFSPMAMNGAPLERTGSLVYARGAEAIDSRLAVAFSGKGGSYLAGPVIDAPPRGGWVLEAWVRAGSIHGQKMIVYNGSSDVNGFGIMQQDDRWCALFGGIQILEADETRVEVGRWTHLALVYYRNRWRLYVDGAPNGPEYDQTPLPARGKFVVGGVPHEPFHGEIDEVRFSRIVGENYLEYLLDRRGGP